MFKRRKLPILVAIGILLPALGWIWKNQGEKKAPDEGKKGELTKEEVTTKDEENWTAEEKAQVESLTRMRSRVQEERGRISRLHLAGKELNAAIKSARAKRDPITAKIDAARGDYQLTNEEQAVIDAASYEEERAYNNYRAALVAIKGE